MLGLGIVVERAKTSQPVDHGERGAFSNMTLDLHKLSFYFVPWDSSPWKNIIPSMELFPSMEHSQIKGIYIITLHPWKLTDHLKIDR